MNVDGMNEVDRAIMKAVEGDIPLHTDPFGSIAESVGCSRDHVLNRLKDWKQKGFLRRIGAVLHHRESGYGANAMIVCEVARNRIKRVSEKIASFENVSHCYQRRTHPGWPYNVYAMVHGRTGEDVEAFAAEIAGDKGVKRYRILYSTEEIKKTSMRYSEEFAL